MGFRLNGVVPWIIEKEEQKRMAKIWKNGNKNEKRTSLITAQVSVGRRDTDPCCIATSHVYM